MEKPATHVDFDALVKQMKDGSAFDDYPAPLGNKDASELSIFYHNPRFPGDFSFGPVTLQIADGYNIPQELANAQRQSFSDALKHYMPQETMAQWMHEYFASDFLHSKAFREQIGALSGMRKTPDKLLDSQYTMRLNAKERNTGENRLYTSEEIALTQKLCAKVPALAVSVFAYQASFVAYIDKLGETISTSRLLSEKQKEHGRQAISVIKSNFSGAGFYRNILPSIAIHYANNHGKNIGEAATAEDFHEAMVYVMKHGFRNKLNYRDESGSVQLQCPAQKPISQASAIDLDAPSSEQAQPEAGMRSKLGTSLFHIYRVAAEQIHTNPRSFAAMHVDLQKSIERALLPREPRMWDRVKSFLSR